MVSRIAKNFQDYFVNVVVQRTGADMYKDGISHSLELPYHVFEDQRSGETLGKLTRIGHMGPTAQPIYAIAALAALGGALNALGHKADIGTAIAAANDVIASDT